MPSKIHLAEDNADGRAIVRVYLEHIGHQAIEAHDGEEAIRRAREDGPDVISMDISRPKLDGWEASRILKADPATAPIPLIALTAHAIGGDRLRVQEVGCDAYLAKPVRPQLVADEVARFVAGNGASTGEG
jgi:two-component system, cell cycle response regulator DivK